MIAILLYGRRVLHREGLRILLETQSSVRVARQASTLEEALDAISDRSCRVAVVDESDGVPMGGQLAGACDSVPVLVVGSDDPRAVRASLCAGVRGYLPAAAGLSDLLAAIRSLHAGGTYVSPSMGPLLMGASPSRQLSRREREILELVSRGYTNRQIGESLFLSESTVKSHMHSLHRKFAVSNRVSLLCRARDEGVLSRAI